MENFNLSEKMYSKAGLFSNKADDGERCFLFKEDVKEFIRRLERSLEGCDCWNNSMCEKCKFRKSIMILAGGDLK